MLSFSKQINTTDERKTFFIENLTGDCLVVIMNLFCCFGRAELNSSLYSVVGCWYFCNYFTFLFLLLPTLL